MDTEHRLKIYNTVVNIALIFLAFIYAVFIFTSRSIINIGSNPEKELAVLIKSGSRVYMNIYNNDGTLKTTFDVYTTIVSFGKQKISMYVDLKDDYIHIFTTDLNSELIYDFSGNMIERKSAIFRSQMVPDHAGGFIYEKRGLLDLIIIPETPLSNDGKNILEETYMLAIVRILPYLIILSIIYLIGFGKKKRINTKLKEMEEETEQKHADEPKRWWE